MRSRHGTGKAVPTNGAVDFRLASSGWQSVSVVFASMDLEPLEEQRDASHLLGAIRAVLEKRPEISEISEITSVVPAFSTVSTSFLTCVLQLPPRLQTKVNETDPCHLSVERFVLVINDEGRLLIGAPCEVEPHFWGPAVRDAVAEMIGRICRVTFVSPSVTPRPLVVKNGPCSLSEDSSSQGEVKLWLGVQSELRDAMKVVYERFYAPLWLLCNTSRVSEESCKEAGNLIKKEYQLLRLVREFLETGFFGIRKRRAISKKIKLGITAVLESLSNHSDAEAWLLKQRTEIGSLIQRDIVVHDNFERNRWWVTTEGGSVDRSSALAIVEHAHSEVQSYGASSVTMAAALAGATVGSLVTLLLTLALPALGRLFG